MYKGIICIELTCDERRVRWIIREREKEERVDKCGMTPSVGFSPQNIIGKQHHRKHHRWTTS